MVNLQQIPANNNYRNCFISNYEDYVFVSSDYSSQELCLIAHDSNDPVWNDALQNNYDLHSICGELLFGKRWKEAAEKNCQYYIDKSKCSCLEHKKLRTLAKNLNFGLSYGMGADKLSTKLNISIKEASTLINKFFTIFPDIRKSLEKSANFGTNNKYIRTLPPFNTIRWFGNEKSADKIERESKNTKIQGSASNMVKLALYYIHNYIEENNVPVKLVCTVHDQIDTICHKDYAKQWKIILTEQMERAAKIIIPSGLLKAETKISNSWEK
jgi:DNA polymerase-1